MCKRPRARPRSKTNAANKPVTTGGVYSNNCQGANSKLSGPRYAANLLFGVLTGGGQCMAMNIDISSGVTTRQSVASAMREQLKPELIQNNNANQNRNNSTSLSVDDPSGNSQNPMKEEKIW